MALITAGAALLSTGCHACSSHESNAKAVVPAPTTASDASRVAVGRVSVELLPQEDPPPGAAAEFKTDFSRHVVPFSEIFSGGPPKDGIAAIDDPKFERVGEADSWLKPEEPVVRVAVGDEVRAYPIQVLMWHELVNDTVGKEALVVTFCPLCNTAIVFKRSLAGAVFDFGATGRLRNSNLIMYDRQTETWWQQATGEAIAGKHVGQKLDFHPGEMISWGDFKSRHPTATVLSRDTGFRRAYGRNPYSGYDDIDKPPFLFRGETPKVLPPVARVLTIEVGKEAVAFPYRVLKRELVANDTVLSKPVVVFWKPGTSSALDDSTVAGGRDVGAATAYSRRHLGRLLTFEAKGARFVDAETGSVWNAHGVAVSGELEGAVLSPVVAINHFWFSWAAFKPETRVFGQ